MAKTSYTADDIKYLKKVYPVLSEKKEDRYSKYKSIDPFPYIDAALLNSADLLKYLLTVGIIEPFDEKKLKGVTYQCTFSGEAHYYDLDEKRMKTVHLRDNEELVLEKNSITYLKIEEIIHVPEYMVLRFNLSVSNVYKGLLLGTGPIVDPGFNGNLFIPLHNLTGNEYVIKKGAPLIRIEFTKLSHSPFWEDGTAEKLSDIEPITKETPSYASFSKLIEDALLDSDKKQFYTQGDVVSVRSSIPETIEESAEMARKAEKKVNRIKLWTTIGGVSAVLALIAIMISVWSLICDTSGRYDSMWKEIESCRQQIYDLTRQLEKAQEKIDLYETERSITR